MAVVYLGKSQNNFQCKVSAKRGVLYQDEIESVTDPLQIAPYRVVDDDLMKNLGKITTRHQAVLKRVDVAILYSQFSSCYFSSSHGLKPSSSPGFLGVHARLPS